MDSSSEKKLRELLQGINPNKISQSKKAVENFLNTDEGRKVAQKIVGLDKDALINSVMKMDKKDIKNKLENMDLSKINAKDIIDKLR